MAEQIQQHTSQIRQWKAYPRADVEAAINKARAEHPDEVYLTIILKMRTSHDKRYVLDVTQKRVTNMKAEVTRRFFDDLEHITKHETDARLMQEVLAFVAEMNPATDETAHAISELERELSQLYGQAISTRFVQSIIVAIGSAGFDQEHAGWALLKQSLERWYTENPTSEIEKTLETARKATISPKPKKGQERITKQVYTSAEILHIKLVITLKKALHARHAAQEQAVCVTALAERALRHADDTTQYTRSIKAIHQHSSGQGNRPLIHTIEAAVTSHRGSVIQANGEMEVLHTWLLQLEADVLRETKQARAKHIPLESAQGVEPLVLRVLADPSGIRSRQP